VKWITPAVLLFLFTPICLAAEKDEKQNPPKSIDELRQQLEKVLAETHIPGLSVAIVHRDRPEWVAGLGKADVASGRATTAETLFRIGSVSKGFASLSILMLADQGKLSLDDPVHKLAPEVWFENRWELSDPVRVVHLLEHTTGWDDIHLREWAKDAPGAMELREALDYDHHSRTSRWRPGTRMAYCNSGPAVAAYIVETLTGQRFEDFVEQNLFRPIGMKTATYFEPALGSATTLYRHDGKAPYRYENLLFRPAGSINASANDMAAYLQFYLNRGAVSGKQILPASDIDRMEIPASTWAARDGMKTGYGLGNFWSIEDGFVYHGHDGGVSGGYTEMAYMPDYGVGYFFSMNSEASEDAFSHIDKLIRAYMTRKLQKPSVPLVVPLLPGACDFAGWYEPDSPRTELWHSVERLAGISWIRLKDGKLLFTSLGGWNETYLPVTSKQFRHVPKTDPPEPVATLELLTPNEGGRFIQAGMEFTTMRRIPAWLAVGELALTAFVVLSIISILAYGPFWMLAGLSKKRRRPAERGMRIWPFMAVLSLIVSAGVIIMCADDSEHWFVRLGTLTGWSAVVFLASLAFAVASLGSAIAWWRAPAEGVRGGVRFFSMIVTVALLIATTYLAYWGIIGVRSWV